jgi:hypothetical protein
MANKRAKKYQAKLALKEGVQWDDLISVAMKPEKKATPKAKRALGKKK